MLSNAYFLAKFGFDTAENEPDKVCPLERCPSRQDSEFAAGTAAGFAGAVAPDRQGPVRTLKLLPDGMKNVRLKYCSPRRALQNYFFSPVS